MEGLIDISEYDLLPDYHQEHNNDGSTDNSRLKHIVIALTVSALFFISINQYRIFIKRKKNEKKNTIYKI